MLQQCERWAWGLLALVCAYFAVLMFSGSSGGRGYFSPNTLEYRTQSETLCLGTGIPLYRGPSEYHQHELVTLLVDKGYWRPKPVASPGWIPLFHHNSMWRDGESRFHRQLFWRKNEWIEWTNKNPEEAARFWPQILELLRNDSQQQATDLLQERLNTIRFSSQS